MMGIKSEAFGVQSLAFGKQSLTLILMAGHAGIFRRIDEGRKIAKKTNQKESEIYVSPGGLRDIIPAAERTSREIQEVSDMGKNVIIMQTTISNLLTYSILGCGI